jgi:hypothetical protein
VRRVLALLPILLAVGCAPAGPFTRAAGAYARVGTESAVALGAAPSLLARSCIKAADVEYLQSRLSRLKFETEGIQLPAEGDYHVPWETWLEKAHPRSLKAGSWKAYCGEIEQTSLAFSTAASALGAYSSALDALVQGGAYDGADLGKTVLGVNKIVTSVSQSEAGPSRAATAIGGALDRFAGVVLRERVERDIEGYVRLADPEVQKLIVALRAYVAAVRVDVESVFSGQLQVIVTFEKLTGLGETATIAPCRVGARAALVQAEKSDSAAPSGSKSGNKKVEPPEAPREIVALRQDAEIQRKALVDVCRSLDQLTKTTNAQELFAFHALARSTEEDIRQTRAVLTGFDEVLGRLGVAHAALVKAGQSTETTDIKALLGTISELVTRLGALQAALAEAKK